VALEPLRVVTTPVTIFPVVILAVPILAVVLLIVPKVLTPVALMFDIVNWLLVNSVTPLIS